MHHLEPYYLWADLYRSEEDEKSPFYGREYSEFEFHNRVYDHLIHPQWDEFGSETLYLKILYIGYGKKYAIIELMGEWNDCINNDIMILKRDLMDILIGEGINHFIIIGENVLNFHASDDSYYEEWFQDVEDGWIAFLNFHPHVLKEFSDNGVDFYVNFGGDLDDISWRSMQPGTVSKKVEEILSHRLV